MNRLHQRRTLIRPEITPRRNYAPMAGCCIAIILSLGCLKLVWAVIQKLNH